MTVPTVTKDQAFDVSHYSFATPCTVPEGYCADGDHAYAGSPQVLYSSATHLSVHYESMDDPGCTDVRKTTIEDVRSAGGLAPDGQKG